MVKLFNLLCSSTVCTRTDANRICNLLSNMHVLLAKVASFCANLQILKILKKFEYWKSEKVRLFEKLKTCQISKKQELSLILTVLQCCIIVCNKKTPCTEYAHWAKKYCAYPQSNFHRVFLIKKPNYRNFS